MKKRILVTGAAGFIGSHLVDLLVKDGYDVHSIDDLSGGFRENLNLKTHFQKLDLRDLKKTTQYIKKICPQLIYHLAADATEGRSQFTPINCTERNYNAYLNLLIPAINNGLKKIILTSSMSVYGSQRPPFVETMPRQPEDIYGLAKTSMEKATEILSKVYKFKYVIIRPHNVYGPKQNMSDPYRNVIAIFINRLLQNKYFYIYGDGKQKRAFTHIDDCAKYLKKAAFIDRAEGEIINIGPTQEYSINQLADNVLRAFFLGKKIPDKYQPHYQPERPLEIKNAWCSVEKAKIILGYKTTVPLFEGVQKTIEWARKKGPQKFEYLPSVEVSNEEFPKVWKQKLL